ncbi:unnamed protein product [Prorocentrum cordatum]|uniref:Copia protein n=1 Tax=Prorocentrum cordatum TaxID=2364126 RepID=A0ABN9RNU7_9DINO|nr:unnamed protein product [Polarella glacialis]
MAYRPTLIPLAGPPRMDPVAGPPSPDRQEQQGAVDRSRSPHIPIADEATDLSVDWARELSRIIENVDEERIHERMEEFEVEARRSRWEAEETVARRLRERYAAEAVVESGVRDEVIQAAEHNARHEMQAIRAEAQERERLRDQQLFAELRQRVEVVEHEAAQNQDVRWRQVVEGIAEECRDGYRAEFHGELGVQRQHFLLTEEGVERQVAARFRELEVSAERRMRAREKQFFDEQLVYEERIEMLHDRVHEESEEAAVWRWQSDSTHEQLQDNNRYSEEFSKEANEYIQKLGDEISDAFQRCVEANARTTRAEVQAESEMRKVAEVRRELAAAQRSAHHTGMTTAPAPRVPIAMLPPLAKRVVNPLMSSGFCIGSAASRGRTDPAAAAPMAAAPAMPSAASPGALPGTGLGAGSPTQHCIASSDSEDEDEAFMRRRTTVKEMKIDPLTSAAGLRKWTNDLMTECCRVSNRSKVRATKYVKSAFEADRVEDVEYIPKKWDLFDTELCSALKKGASGAIGRQLTLHQEKNARFGTPASGRAALYMILRRFELDSGKAHRVHLAALNALKYNGDLEVYLDALDARLALMSAEPDEALLLAIVEPELRKAPDLAFEFAQFDRALDDAPEKTLQFLCDSARRACARAAQNKTVDALTPTPKQVKQVRQAAPKGKAKFGDNCKHVHWKDSVHTPTAAWPAGTAVTLGRQPGDARKFFADGKCSHGDKCIYKHGDGDKRDLAAVSKAKREAEAKQKGKGGGKKLHLCSSGSLCGASDKWVLDTATTFDASGKGLQGAHMDLHDQVAVETGGGNVHCDRAVVTHLSEIGGDVEATVLEDADETVRVLTVGRRCAQLGFEFTWKPFAPAADVFLPDGCRVGVKVDPDFVPYVESQPKPRRDPSAGKRLLVNVAVVDDGALIDDALPLEADPPQDDDVELGEDEHEEDEKDVEQEDGGEISQIGIVDQTVDPGHDDAARHVARVLEGGITSYDGDLMQDDKILHRIQLEDSFDDVVLPCDTSRLTKEHLALRQPAMPKYCPGCRGGKHAKWPSRRRPVSGACVRCADADERPFGACVHMDHIVMQPVSEAARTAKYSLNMLDERAKFAGVFPASSRDADTIVEAHHTFDSAVPEIRRWWSDNAPELAAARRKIRRMRPFAHYRSIPRAPQSNGVIERFNRTVVEGARALLLMAAFPASWWVCAICYWCMRYNGHCRGADGFTPHERRYDTSAEYEQYPFGALVFVAAARRGGAKPSKWSPRMVPHVLVGIGCGPGFAWNRTCGVVKLERLLSSDRPSRACIRYSAEVDFPDRIIFPMRQRLKLAGASRDASFPAPAVTDDNESWALQLSEVSEEPGDEAYDGAMEGGAPKLEPGNFVESVVLDPEDSQAADDPGPEEEVVEKNGGEQAATEHEPKDEPAELGRAELEVEENRAPKGWRIDTFPHGHHTRTISVPPWSRRPPTVLPEAWLMFKKSHQEKLRQEWKEKDPVGFAAQEARKAAYEHAKRTRGSLPASAANAGSEGARGPPAAEVPAAAQLMHVGRDRPSVKPEYEAAHVQDGPAAAAAGAMATRLSQSGLQGDILRTARTKIQSGQFKVVVVDISTEEDSMIAELMPQRALTVRVTEGDELCRKETIRALHGIVRACSQLGIPLHVWVSTVRTPGELPDRRVEVAVGLCRHVVKQGGYIYWGWPPTSSVWLRSDVRQLLEHAGSDLRDVSMASLSVSAAEGQSDDPFEPAGLRKLLEPRALAPEMPPESIDGCRDESVDLRGPCSQELARLIWQSILPIAGGHTDHDDTAQHDVGRKTPKWSVLVTRKVPLKLEEAKSAKARAAIDKAEVMTGRIFGILGETNAEVERAEDRRMKFRAVFQGSNIRTETGTAAVNLYEEVSNSPASFVAIRCTMAAAILKRLSITVRDALQAYLQARINVDGRIETWVEIPREWWPDSWFEGGDRSKPLYVLPVRLLLLALYGHPEAGALWEKKLTQVLLGLGWHSVPSWSGVFVHADGSMLTVYVDDLLLAALGCKADAHWEALCKSIEFKDEPAPVNKFSGAYYALDPFDPKLPDAPRTVTTSMIDYTRAMVERFCADAGLGTTKPVDSPYISAESWAQDSEEAGRFADVAASHSASPLFLCRVGRPDLAAATQRLCSGVSRWTTVHDLALIRLMMYAACTSTHVLKGTLALADVDDLLLLTHSDADWNGDPMTSKSVAGWWIELFSPASGRSFPLSWGCSQQSSTGGCTAETETVAFSHVVRRGAIPIQMLLDEVLPRRIGIARRVDNMQTIQAATKGYSKRLRHLPRTQRVCVGMLHEMLNDRGLLLSIEHCPTLQMKADLFTKVLNGPKFRAALEMIHMVQQA